MFITFEGIEGSGKSTVLNRLCEQGLPDGRPHLRTREPGGSALGRELRALLLDPSRNIVPEAELFLYLADRAQHVREIIRPALAQGHVVLSDRYADSTIVYQGYGRGLDIEELYALNNAAVGGLWPDLTLVFDLDPHIGLARARARDDASGVAHSQGKFEAEALPFHQRIRAGYLTWAQRFPQRFRVIDSSGPPEDVLQSALNAIHAAMP